MVRSIQPEGARACARAVRLVLVLLLVLVPARASPTAAGRPPRRAACGRPRCSRLGETQAAPVLSARRAALVTVCAMLVVLVVPVVGRAAPAVSAGLG